MASKYALLISATVFLLTGFLGAGHLGMAMRPDGQMSRCPFMGVATICQMNLLEHIAAWQNMFSALPQKDIFASLALLPPILLTFLLLGNLFRVPSKEFLSAETVRYKRRNILLIPTSLQLAFSDGILHPKVF